MAGKIDRNIQWIDNHDSDPGRAELVGVIDPDDTLVVKVQDEDSGEWVFKGVSVGLFVSSLYNQYQFDEDLNSPDKRRRFLSAEVGLPYRDRRSELLETLRGFSFKRWADPQAQWADPQAKVEKSDTPSMTSLMAYLFAPSTFSGVLLQRQTLEHFLMTANSPNSH